MIRMERLTYRYLMLNLYISLIHDIHTLLSINEQYLDNTRAFV